MSWSVVKKEGKTYEPVHLFQPFTQEEWDRYPFVGEEKLRWFREAKLGLYFHVGISALGKVDIGWSRHTHKLPDPGFGPIPDEVYDGWAKEIKMEDFHAEEWINLAIAGGFKYVVIITKHHDGFHMWDTAYSEYKVTNSPMGRDYLKELIDACHKKDMPVGLYYSQRDWHHPDYEPIDVNDADRSAHIPFYTMKDGKKLHAGKKHTAYIRYMHNTVLELMEKYGKIDILWWDAAWYCDMFTEAMWDSFELEKKVREKQPHIIINNRAGLPGDFDTPECRVGFVQRDRAWETCMPMGNAWAWTGDSLKPIKDIIHQFLYTVCGDGNYLLSIGTMPNGKIAPAETECIHKLGNWLKQYGEAVYGTRSGPWNPGYYGGSVYRENTIYVHIINRPLNGKVVLPLGDNCIREMSCMTGQMPDVIFHENQLTITIPDTEFTDIIVRLVMEQDVCVSPEGIVAVEEVNRFMKNPTLYGTIICRTSVKKGGYVINLNECRKVTVIVIPNAAGTFTVETSLDGETWEASFCGEVESDTREVELESYSAGAPVCGKELEFIRIWCEEDVPETIIYGF